MATTKEFSLFIPQLSLFLISFGFTMNLAATQLMILHKTCLTSGHEEHVCKYLHEHPIAEDEVQLNAAPIIQKFIMLTFIPAAFMTLVLGPLSDIYGRKHIIMIPVVAGSLATVGYLLQYQQQEISPVLLFGASSFIGLGGGLGTFMSTLISYVTDSTLPERRTERLSLLLPFLALGRTLSTLCSGVIWEQAGASVMYILSFLCYISVIISLSFLKESQTQSDDSKESIHTFSLQGLFRNATAGWRVVSATRENGCRKKLLMLLTVGPAAIFFNAADITVVGLSTRRPPFQWSPSTLSYFSAAKLVATVLGTALLVPLYNKITGTKKVQGDLNVMCISYTSAALLCLVMMVATSTVHLTIVPFLFGFVGALGPVTRSLSSKLVKQSESGALNGLTSFLNNMTAAVTSAVMNSLYTSTVHTFPNAAFLAIVMVMISCLLIVLMLKREFREYPETDEKKGD